MIVLQIVRVDASTEDLMVRISHSLRDTQRKLQPQSNRTRGSAAIAATNALIFGCFRQKSVADFDQDQSSQVVRSRSWSNKKPSEVRSRRSASPRRYCSP